MDHFVARGKVCSERIVTTFAMLNGMLRRTGAEGRGKLDPEKGFRYSKAMLKE